MRKITIFTPSKDKISRACSMHGADKNCRSTQNFGGECRYLRGRCCQTGTSRYKDIIKMDVEVDIWYGLQSSFSGQEIVAGSSKYSSRHRGSQLRGTFLYKSRDYALVTIDSTTLGQRSGWYLALQAKEMYTELQTENLTGRGFLVDPDLVESRTCQYMSARNEDGTQLNQ